MPNTLSASPSLHDPLYVTPILDILLYEEIDPLGSTTDVGPGGWVNLELEVEQ
jgi:hypothetical protein